MCGWRTWRRPTFPRLETEYHGRWSVSRPSSEWDRVLGSPLNHQVGEPHVTIEKLGMGGFAKFRGGGRSRRRVRRDPWLRWARRISGDGRSALRTAIAVRDGELDGCRIKRTTQRLPGQDASKLAELRKGDRPSGCDKQSAPSAACHRNDGHARGATKSHARSSGTGMGEWE